MQLIDLFLLGVFNTDVEYVVSSQNNVAQVRRGCTISELGRTFKYHIHVTVTVYHLSPVLNVVLQLDTDVVVDSLDEKIKRFLRWFQRNSCYEAHSDRQASYKSLFDNARKYF